MNVAHQKGNCHVLELAVWLLLSTRIHLHLVYRLFFFFHQGYKYWLCMYTSKKPRGKTSNK